MTLVRYFCVCALSFAVHMVINGQDFFEDFEDGSIDDWTIIRGSADLVSNPMYEGNAVLRLFDGPNEEDDAIIQHNTFSGSLGTYAYAVLAADENSDGDFAFQFVDDNNFYQLSHKPSGTDNPELRLYKVVNGEYMDLAAIEAIGGTTQWIQFVIERTCDGSIIVTADGLEVINVVDRSLMVDGTIRLRGWDQFSYFDSIVFTAIPTVEPTNLTATICEGNGYFIGDQIFTESGTFSDTTFDDRGCVDAITFLDLEVLPISWDTFRIEICSGEEILIDSIVYAEPAMVTDTFLSVNGCDSIRTFRIEVLEHVFSALDSSICPGFAIEIGDSIITQPGMYVIPLLGSASSGCDSIIELRVSYDTLMFTLGPDIQFCPTESAALIDAGYDDVTWNTGSNSTVLEVIEEGTYVASVMDVRGCQAVDSIHVTALCAADDFYAPNVFRPDAVPPNNTFHLQFQNLPTNFRLQIFDRWGSLLFNSSNPSIGWSGTHNGKPMTSGVYVWKASVDNAESSGVVTLVQ